MLQEKTMVADTLSAVNAELKNYGGVIAETENQQLRQTFIQMRNACETSQYELFTLAKEHQYYTPAAKATDEEVQTVKSIFQA